MYISERLLERQPIKLAPYETLPDITAPGWDCEPLPVHRWNEKGQHLIAVGVRHDTLPSADNLHYAAIKKANIIFQQVAKKQPTTIIMEGGYRQPYGTPEGSYWEGAEGSLTAHHYKRSGIYQQPEHYQHCFEPPLQGTAHLLESGFYPEEIATFLFARFVPTWYRTARQHTYSEDPTVQWTQLPPKDTQPTFREFVESRLEGAGLTQPTLPHFMHSYDQLAQLFEDIYQFPIEPDNPEMVQFLLEETVGYMLSPRTSRIHQIAIAANQLRDLELAKGITKLWNEGYSILVPFGYPHIATLKPHLDTLGSDFQAFLDAYQDNGGNYWDIHRLFSVVENHKEYIWGEEIPECCRAQQEASLGKLASRLYNKKE